MPVSRASTRAAAVEGARPMTTRSPRERAHVAQHRRLAGPGPALHADDPVRRQQDGADRLFLSRREAGIRQARRKPRSRPQAPCPPRRRSSLRRSPRAPPSAPGRSRTHGPRVRASPRPDARPAPGTRIAPRISSSVCRPRRVPQGQSLQLAGGEDRLPLLQVAASPATRPSAPREPPAAITARRERRTTGTRPSSPARAAQIVLSIACSGSALRLRVASAAICAAALPVVPAPLVHVRFHLLPAGRERVPDPPVVARDLEAPQAPRHRRQDRVAPCRSGAAPAGPGSRPRSVSRSGAGPWARCSSSDPRRRASCSRSPRACAAAGRDCGSRCAGTARPPCRGPRRADACPVAGS